MENEALLQHCKELAFSGKDYEFIRQDLERRNLPEEEMLQILVKADEYLAHYQVALQQKTKAGQQMIIGTVLILFGVFIYGITITSFEKKYILAWGAILSGAWILKEGYKAYQLPLSDWENPLDQAMKRIKN